MKLTEVQSLFKSSLLALHTASATSDVFRPAGSLTLQEAFAVYHRSYLARLSDALGESFEAVWWVLGDDLFRSVCRDYIHEFPSSSYHLQDYGARFTDFLTRHHDTKEILFLHDLARFEWLIKELGNTPTPQPLPAEQFQDLVKADDFKIHFIEGMSVFESPYAVYDIWRQRKEPAYHFDDINWHRPESLLIYKKQKKIYVQRVEPLEAQVLEDLKEGRSMSEAMAGFSAHLTPDRISAFYQLIAGAGIVEDVLILET